MNRGSDAYPVNRDWICLKNAYIRGGRLLCMQATVKRIMNKIRNLLKKVMEPYIGKHHPAWFRWIMGWP
jgi:hypothetical protein